MDTDSTWAPERGSETGAWMRITLAQLKTVADGLIAQEKVTSSQAFVFARWAGYSEFEARVICLLYTSPSPRD